MDELLFESKMRSARSLPFLEGEAMVFSAMEPGKETANEDAAALIRRDEGSGAIVVCDGAGGTPAGELAARIVIEQIREQVAAAPDSDERLRTAVLNGVESANSAILDRGQGSATTFAAVTVSGSIIRPYHVGDSIILLTGQRGSVKLQTVSHSPVGFALESGMLDETDAIHHEERHVVSNLVGTPEMRIEVGPPIEMARYDTLLLASDGLSDNLFVDEVISIIRKGNIEEAAQVLAATALARMTQREEGRPSKPDDLTFVLYRRRPNPKR